MVLLEGDGPLPPDDTALFSSDDPYALFDAWYEEAKGTDEDYPNAMQLATVDADGLPDLRTVLLKGRDEGFVFYTNTTSAKGRALAEHPKAALNFYWKSLQRQVRLRGLVAPVSDAEADAYFATRPKGSQIGAWASAQSQPLDARATLEAEVARLEELYKDQEVPRPPHWSGYRVTPLQMEFWRERPYRLHDRLVFSRSDAAEPWTSARLYP